MASALSLILGGLQLIAGIALILTGIGAGIGLKLVISGGLSLLSQLMANNTGRGGLKNSLRYGFDNLSNGAREGGPKPIIYGTETVAPQWISTNLIQEGDTQTLLLLGMIGEGEIDHVSQVTLNDVPIESLPGASYETRMGTATQTAIKDFNQIGAAYDVGKRLSNDDGTSQHAAEVATYAMKAQGDALVLALTWPGGLYKVDNNNNLDSDTVGLKVEYKRVSEPDSAYGPFVLPTPLPGDWYSDGTAGIWKTKAKTQAPLRRQIRLNFASKDAYSVRVTGTTSDGQSGTGSHVRVPTLTSIIEVVNDTRTYPYVALIGIRCPASSQMSGSLPRVKCVVRGRKVLIGPSYASEVYSDNPIWCLRDAILSTRYGLGKRFTSADIDATSWEAAAAECDVTVAPPNRPAEALHMLGLVVDTKGAFREWAGYMLSTCRGTLYESNGTLKIARDKAGASSAPFDSRAAYSTRPNIIAGPVDQGGQNTLLVHQLEDTQRPTGIRVRYTDREKAFQQRIATVTDVRIDVGAITSGPFVVGEKIKGATSGAIGWVTASYANGEHWIGYAQDGAGAAFVTGEVISAVDGTASCTSSSAPYAPTPDRWLDVQLFGCTRLTAAIREGRYLLNTAQRRNLFATFGMFLGDVNVEVGDIIDVSCDWLPWTNKKFTVLTTSRDFDGQGQIHAREYDADAYAAPFDPIPLEYAFTAGGAPPLIPGFDEIYYGSDKPDPTPATSPTSTTSSTPATPPGAGTPTTTGTVSPAPSPPPAATPAPAASASGTKVTTGNQWTFAQLKARGGKK